ncbi:MAG: hypothetical protein J2O48_07215 [Solirubrobacterales bacterium]|nr:hypothetical protein [Solirubrobacterales bacterium]
MSAPQFRFVTLPSALRGTPAGWAREMLDDGEIALLASEGLEPINELAHELGQSAITVVRSEPTPAEQDQAVIEHARSMPLIWVAGEFSEQAQTWARARGPMTLLVQTSEPLSDAERRRIDRFVASLEPQSE